MGSMLPYIAYMDPMGMVILLFFYVLDILIWLTID